MVFVPSDEQRAILDAVTSSRDNMAINALAGTGKTTVLVEIAKKLPMTKPNGKRMSALFCAFNKSIVSELESRLKGTVFVTKTFHGIGFGALRSHAAKQGWSEPSPNAEKYRDIVRSWADESIDLRGAIAEFVKKIPDPAKRQQTERELFKDVITAGVQLAHFVRTTLIDPHNQPAVLDVLWKYRLDDDLYGDEGIGLVLVDALAEWMDKGELLARAGNIDFDDMVYLPVRWKLKVWQNDYVMVDEAQDLSPAQRSLIAMSLLPSGRIFIVGDPNQSIYAFTGSDCDSFDLTVQAFNATVYPMTLTRRCAAVITRHAADLVPQFRCPPDKLRGAAIWLPEEHAVDALQAGDLVVCRVKSPLVGLLLKLLVATKPAAILGNDFGKSFISLLERLENRDGFTFDAPGKAIEDYTAEKLKMFERKHDEMGAAQFLDQIEGLKFIFEAATTQGYMMSMDALKAFINELFSDSTDGKILLATAHKSKGLEAERVFILSPEKLPLEHPNMNAESRMQEYNLDYVARTRAKSTLVVLTNEAYRAKLQREGETMPLYMQHGFNGTPKQIDLAPLPAGLFEQPAVVVTHADTANSAPLNTPVAPPSPEVVQAWLDRRYPPPAVPLLCAPLVQPALAPPADAPPVSVIAALPEDVIALLERIAGSSLNPLDLERSRREAEIKQAATQLLEKYRPDALQRAA